MNYQFKPKKPPLQITKFFESIAIIPKHKIIENKKIMLPVMKGIKHLGKTKKSIEQEWSDKYYASLF